MLVLCMFFSACCGSISIEYIEMGHYRNIKAYNSHRCHSLFNMSDIKNGIERFYNHKWIFPEPNEKHYNGFIYLLTEDELIALYPETRNVKGLSGFADAKKFSMYIVCSNSKIERVSNKHLARTISHEMLHIHYAVTTGDIDEDHSNPHPDVNRINQETGERISIWTDF